MTKRILLLMMIASLSFGQWAYDYSQDPMEASLLGNINLLGNHLLNDQTTTNMMADGTVMHFDGVDDVVTITDHASIQNIFDGGGTISTWIYPLSDGEGDFGRILAKRATGWNLQVHDESGTNVNLRFFYDFDGSDGTWDLSGAVVPLNTWSHIEVAYDNSSASNVPVIYLNGTPQTLSSTQPTGTRSTDAGNDLLVGNNGVGGQTFDGDISEVKLHNTALTASEVKDLSASTPYKWIGASQTSVVTGTNSDFSGAGNWLSSGLTAMDVNSSVASRMYYVGNGGNDRVSLNTVLTVGKEYYITLKAQLDPLSAGSMSEQTLIMGTGADAENNATFRPTLVEGTFTGTFIASKTNLTLGVFSGGTPNAYAIGDVLVNPIGVVADYPSYAISDATWYDVSGNANDGAVTGASVQHYKGIHSDGTDLFVADALTVDGAGTFGGDVSVGGFLNVGTANEVTLSSNEITATQTYHKIDTEGDAALDSIETINGGAEGDMIIFKTVTSARDVTFRDAVGNMNLASDFVMTGSSDQITLLKSSGDWFEVSRSSNN